MTTYDRSGARVDNSIFAVSSISLVGKEIYKYDAKGNIVEMTVRGDDGSIVSQEVYAYEFDAVGNWKKMTTSVALIENGDITYEPTEVTYRTIAYYLTDDVAKVIKSPTPPINTPEPTPAVLPAKKEAPEEKAGAQNPVKAVGEAVQLAAGQSAIPAERTQASAPTVSATPVPRVSETGGGVETDKAKEGGDTKKEEPPVIKKEEPLATKKEEPPARKEEPPAAEPPAPRPPVKPVSGGVLNGKAIVLPLPAYTEVAKRAGDQGTVSVEVVIDVTGKVISAKAVSGPGTLRRVAEDAARRAEFSPTLLSGQPLRITGVINYNFTLKQ
jgi:TonB family protein